MKSRRDDGQLSLFGEPVPNDPEPEPETGPPLWATASPTPAAPPAAPPPVQTYRQGLLEQIIRDTRTLEEDPDEGCPGPEFYEERIAAYLDAIHALDRDASR